MFFTTIILSVIFPFFTISHALHRSNAQAEPASMPGIGMVLGSSPGKALSAEERRQFMEEQQREVERRAASADAKRSAQQVEAKHRVETKESTAALAVLRQADERRRVPGDGDKAADAHPIDSKLVKCILENYAADIEYILKRWKEAVKESDSSSYMKEVTIFGPPGAGKLTVAKIIATDAGLPFFKYSASEIMHMDVPKGRAIIKNGVIARSPGFDILDNVFQEAINLKKPCCIIIDGFEAIINQQNSIMDTDASLYNTTLEQFEIHARQISRFHGQQFKTNFLARLLAWCGKCSKCPIFFIFTLTQEVDVDAKCGLCHIGYSRKISLPDEKRRHGILSFYMNLSNKVVFDASASAEVLAKKTVGFTPAQLRQLVRESAAKAFSRDLSVITVTLEHCVNALKAIEAQKTLGSSRPQPLDSALLKSVLETAPQSIGEFIELWKTANSEESYKKLPKKLVLVGPSDAGKTVLGRAAAQECGLLVFMYNAELLVRVCENSGPEVFEKIFADAVTLKKPCVIMIDNFDALVLAAQAKGSLSQLSSLWILLDLHKDCPILFIATIKNFDALPDPLKDRFSNHVKTFLLPDERQRQAILAYYTRPRKTIKFAEDISTEALAQKTEGFAHADLKELVRDTIGYALGRTYGCDSDKFKADAVATVTMDGLLYSIMHVRSMEAYRKRRAQEEYEKSWKFSFKKFGEKMFKEVAMPVLTTKLFRKFKWA